MRIGDRVRNLRLEQGLNASELARKARLPTSTVTRVEQGTSSPTSATVEKLAQGLGVDPGELFPKAESLQPSPVDSFADAVGDLEKLFEEDPEKLRDHVERVRETRDITYESAKRHIDNLPRGSEYDREHYRFTEARVALARVLGYLVGSSAGSDLTIAEDPGNRSAGRSPRPSQSEADTDTGAEAG
jgi:transcriptional regulator with XRE-family HTH domain